MLTGVTRSELELRGQKKASKLPHPKLSRGEILRFCAAFRAASEPAGEAGRGLAGSASQQLLEQRTPEMRSVRCS
eukprot:15464518-Alexandrium_andersonii.AAC.2